jgi:peptidoglycan/xylan/chitin deacetylase (PgdA/CDA1 family)
LPALSSRLLRGIRVRARSLFLGILGVPLAYPVRNLARRSGAGAGVALVYHRVGEPAGDPRRELVPALATSLFAEQAHHLASHYNVVSASNLLRAIGERQPGSPFPVAITFDDDLSSHLDVAAPILASAGVTATFFVSGASLEAPQRFWWERLQAAFDRELDLATAGLDANGMSIHDLARGIQNLPPGERDEIDARLVELVGDDPPDSGLRADALRALAKLDFEIGFHTRRHDLLTRLGEAELSEAMRLGRSELEEVVRRPLRTISYPYGGGDGRVAVAAREAGFAAGFTGSGTAVRDSSEPLLLGRLVPSYRSTGEFAFDVAWTLLRGIVSGRARARAARQGRRASPT